MRKLIAVVVAALAIASGLVVGLTPAAQACTRLTCPPMPDKSCGISGHLCSPAAHMGPHRVRR